MKTEMSITDFLSQNQVAQISDFILSYEQESGGFSFSKYTPATREDTYYAIKGLNLINYRYQGKRILNYLKQLIPKRIISYRYFFQLLYLIYAYDLKSKNLMLSLIKRSEPKYHNLSDLYYYVLSMNTLNLPFTQRTYEIVTKYSIESLRNLPNTVKYLILLSTLNIAYNKDYYLNYLNLCQSGDGGYGFLPRSTSFLENVCYALRAYRYLQTPPQHTDKILAFIQRCQGRRGGFGRKDVSLPTIRSTSHAFESLIVLRTFTFL
jgi:hypothetical protein